MRFRLILISLAFFASAAVAQSGKLEVFSWWTSGGEAAALDSLFQAYSAAASDVEIVNATVAGGGGSSARAVLQTRLAGGDPPDTWQVHPGWELLGQYVDPGFVEPLNDLYEANGWNEVMPQALTDLSSRDGNTYLVTVGVHRGNGFWYTKSCSRRMASLSVTRSVQTNFLRLRIHLRLRVSLRFAWATQAFGQMQNFLKILYLAHSDLKLTRVFGMVV